jgi:hypothetical protein
MSVLIYLLEMRRKLRKEPTRNVEGAMRLVEYCYETFGYDKWTQGRTFRLHDCQVLLSVRDGYAWIGSIYALKEGVGAGTRAMTTLCSLADRYGATLAGQPIPLAGPVGIPRKTVLVRWYSFLGFHLGPKGMMIRPPRT